MSPRDFQVLIRENAALIDRVLRAYEASVSIREELAQETALALWRALPSFRAQASYRTLIARIAQNVAVSHIRRQLRAPEIDPLDGDISDNTLLEDLEQRSRYQRLVSAIRKLPLNYRQVVTLALEDFSAREIAETLDLSEGAVAVRLTRARAMLSTAMGVQ